MTLSRREFCSVPVLAAAPTKQWTIYLIQHSHIDVGYTERQEVIADFHAQFVRQALDLALAPAQKDRPPEARFKFTCEGFWQVEQFLAQATPQDRARLVRAFRDGSMELTAGYFHMTELPDQELLRRSLSFAAAFARENKLPLNAAMSCDVNGFSWGFAEALAEAQVRYFSVNLNHHHGAYPFGRPLVPFYWESPTGKRILTWSGVAYHRANVLGLMGGLTPDTDPAIPGLDMPGSGKFLDVKDTALAEQKLLPVLAHLENNGYAYDFLPLMGSGAYTDNSPPGDMCCDIVGQWNRKFGAQVRIRTATLAEFFAHLEKNAATIPVHRGEWTDWWSDGVASTPRDTMLYRNALRSRRLVQGLDPQGAIVSRDRLDAIDRKLLLYAEHTFGYSRTSSASVLAEQIFTRKTQHAVEADELSSAALWQILRRRGEGAFTARRPFEYRVVNPLEVPVRCLVALPTDFWERTQIEAGIKVVDAAGRVYLHQLEPAPRGLSVTVLAELAPMESRVFRIEPAPPTAPPAPPANQHYAIRWNPGQGIVSLGIAGTEVLDGSVPLAAPVYQIFPGLERWTAGRTSGQRVRPRPQNAAGKCTSIKRTVTGPLYERWEFAYEVPGATSYVAEATFCHALPTIDLTVRLTKTDVRDPEGMYVAFPFAIPGASWVFDKPGAPVRPGTDQLPGACCDYYCLQHGAALLTPRGGIVVATLDAPLVHVGHLRLWEYNTTIQPMGALFSWLTNNKWETNFRLLMGGAYEFRYRIEAAASLDRARQLSYPPLVLRA